MLKPKPTGMQSGGRNFFVGGVVAMLVGLALAVSKASFLYTAEKVTGTAVVAGNCPEVRYRDKEWGMTHTWTFGCMSPPPFEWDQSVTVWYDRKNPDEAEADYFTSLWGFALLPGSVGLMFCLMGLPMMGAATLINARRRRFMRENPKVSAEVFRISRVPGIRAYGSYPCVLEAKADLNGQSQVFSSPAIWYDPTEFALGKKVDVYYRPGNPRRHLVDLDFLPPFRPSTPARERDIERIRRSGSKVSAKVTDIHGGSRDEDGRIPYTLRAEAMIGGYMHVFIHPFIRNPHKHVKDGCVDVYYRDGGNFKYVMDTSFVPGEEA